MMMLMNRDNKQESAQFVLQKWLKRKSFGGCVTAQHVSDDNYEDDVDGLIQTIKSL